MKIYWGTLFEKGCGQYGPALHLRHKGEQATQNAQGTKH